MPNIYRSLAARAVGAKVINNVNRLGTAFVKRGPLTALVRNCRLGASWSGQPDRLIGLGQGRDRQRGGLGRSVFQ